jgi:uncharacterized protein YndB with AHSA1/START domain
VTAAAGPWDGTPAIRLRRRYDATPAAVFRAFTDPRLLCEWWGPDGFTITEIDFPATEGQAYRVRLRAPDGQFAAHVGTFLRVTPCSELVYSWRWVEGPFDQVETLVELSFTADGAGVIVEKCHSRFANQAECDRHTGWADSFDQLARWLESAPPTGRLAAPARP